MVGSEDDSARLLGAERAYQLAAGSDDIGQLSYLGWALGAADDASVGILTPPAAERSYRKAGVDNTVAEPTEDTASGALAEVLP
jgi:hypothetical protein